MLNSLSRTLWFTECTVNALIRMNNNKVRAFIETVHRTDIDTVSVFALDTVLCHDKTHCLILSLYYLQYRSTFAA